MSTTVLCTSIHTVHQAAVSCGVAEGAPYKEGDIKFLEFCGVAWKASRDGRLLQLMGRERVVIPLESPVRSLGEELGLNRY